MGRDYQTLTRGPGVFVPRWTLVAVAAAALAYVSLRILIPPSWIIQRLDSPDGTKSAILSRTQHMRQHFSVRVKEGFMWYRLMESPPITNDFRVDLGERLRWSEDSRRLYFSLGGETVWGYDFEAGRTVDDL